MDLLQSETASGHEMALSRTTFFATSPPLSIETHCLQARARMPMNIRLRLIAAAAFLVFAGCNADPGSRREIALLRAELVDLENEYYSLKSRCKADGSQTESSAFCDDSGTVNHSGETWPAEHYPVGSYPSGGFGGSLDPGNSTNPVIQTMPAGQAPATNPTGGTPVPEEIDLTPAGPLPGGQSAGNQSDGARSGRPPHTPAAEVLFVGDQTTARDHDGDGKPDGIEAGFVLLDASGQAVTGPARLVFSLMDDALPSGQQRLGLWEHNPALNTSSGSATATGATLRVFLPWQGSRPEHDELWLFVRLVGNGSSSEASTPVRLSAMSSAPATSSRTAKTGPEIEIDLDDLNDPASGSPTRRPRWRATR